ncbi:MAG: CpXC domain-containing protein [Deltaproteobacteria bacterium]|nr:CpXC domain-containing protein [Deltaproteobacteria bacterium]MCB9785443.1 CpXC domain-containing protein [Deltaproteobacteria bacterium]
MSWFDVKVMTCPTCQREFEAGTAETINVTRMPWAREQILAGHFHTVECPHCDAVHHVDRGFLYTDFGRNHFVMVHANASLGDWPALEEVTGKVFSDVTHHAPPLVQQMATQFTVRAVFGLRDLEDKLRLWDAGLDDRVVELLKLELMVQTPALARRADLRLSVQTVAESEDRLEIEAWSHDGSHPPVLYGAALARYRELDARRAELEDRYPGLFFKPFASFRRLARETAEPSEVS